MSSPTDQQVKRSTLSPLERPCSAPPVKNEPFEEEDDLEFFSPSKLEELEDELESVPHTTSSGRRKSKSEAFSFKPSSATTFEMWSTNPLSSPRSASRFTFTTRQVETGDSLVTSLLPSLQTSFQPSAVGTPRALASPRHLSAPVSPNKTFNEHRLLEPINTGSKLVPLAEHKLSAPTPRPISVMHRPRSMGNLVDSFDSMNLQSPSHVHPYQVHPGVQLLQMLKLNTLNTRLELSQVVGMAYEFATDQHGSRYIQQCFEFVSIHPIPEQIRARQTVFTELAPHLLSLMTDVFGNYVIQKIFEFGTREQRITMANAMQGNVLVLSNQMYGCRVIQKALEFLPPEQQLQVVKELDGHVLQLVTDQNGNHVIQKCIECVPATLAPFLVASFKGCILQMAQHAYGCRVIQRIFEHGLPTEEVAMFASLADRRILLDELFDKSIFLSQDQYGNYVVQHILEYSTSTDRTKLIKILLPKIFDFSCHKFASNVVEKCVTFGSHSDRVMLLDEIDRNGGFEALLKDQFANYVVQKMLDVLSGDLLDRVLASIKPHLPTLRRFTYGKHILAKIDRLLVAKNGGAPKRFTTTTASNTSSQQKQTSTSPSSIPIVCISQQDFPPL